jgi:hypothetical protein
MRMRFAAATFLAIGAGSAAVGALDLLGSDTMNLLTQSVLAAGVCPAVTPGSLVYLGTGSGNGETGMANATQGVAPMSRFLQGASPKGKACNDVSAKVAGGLGSNGEHAVGIAVALDGVGLAANTNQLGTCNDPGKGVAYAAPKSLIVSDQPGSAAGLQCPNCTGAGLNEYVPTQITSVPADPEIGPWADYLRVLFFGLHHPATPGAASPRDCDSDVRRTLIASYKNIFQDAACTGGAGCAAGIRHLWRRDDASGTTDVFAALLGTDFRSFCNVGPTALASTVAVGAGDFLDKDPVRIACSGTGAGTGEQVCGSAIPTDSPSGTAAAGNLGTLGFLQVIFPPDSKDVPVAELYPTAVCGTGENELLPATKTTFSGVCPGGNPSFGGKCFTSVIRTVPGGSGPGTFNANCIQVKSSAACPFLTPAGTDCRGATLWMRKPNGDIVRDTSVIATGRNHTLAAFKIHAFRPNQAPVAGTSEGCALAQATEQIGCLVGKADHCSMGFAGRSAVIPAGVASALRVNQLQPEKADIQHLVDKLAPAYPLARKLYLNSISGFQGATVTSNELALAKCYSSDATMLVGGPASPTSIIAANGFVELPDPKAGHTRALCQDFDESQPAGKFGCGAAGNVNVCQSAAYGALGLPVTETF